MLIRVKNIQYFDWEIPDELLKFSPYSEEYFQQLVDEHFDPDNLSVDQSSDDYYEFEEVL